MLPIPEVSQVSYIQEEDITPINPKCHGKSCLYPLTKIQIIYKKALLTNEILYSYNKN